VKRVLIISILLGGISFGDTPLPQPSLLGAGKNIKKDKESPFEIGRRFGKGLDSNSTNSKTKRTTADILEEMLKVQKKQLKTQNKILKILEDQFDPQPKKIVVNGKECIENSSAECFKMPLLHPDAKKVPVLRKFVESPTVENAAAYLKWHAKFLKSAYRGGNAITLAVNKYGAKAYPMNFDRFDYDTPGAYSSVLKKRNNKLVLNTIGDGVSFYFFLGKNPDADMYAVDNYAKFVKEIPHIKYNIVFYSKGSKEAFLALASRLKNIESFRINASSLLVSKKAFSKHNVYTTPMVNMLVKKTNKMRSILVGRSSSDGIIDNAIETLEFDKVLKDAHSPGYEKWKRTGDYSKGYYKETYGVDLNQTYIDNAYKKEQ
jgi:hypothetical protein